MARDTETPPTGPIWLGKHFTFCIQQGTNYSGRRRVYIAEDVYLLGIAVALSAAFFIIALITGIVIVLCVEFAQRKRQRCHSYTVARFRRITTAMSTLIVM